MGERGPVYVIRPRSFGDADFCHSINGIQILFTILDCKGLTGLCENVGNVVNDSLASVTKVSDDISCTLFPGVPVGT